MEATGEPGCGRNLVEFEDVPWLSELADYGKGSTTGDSPRFLFRFWELPRISGDHVQWLNSPDSGSLWSGRSQICTVPLDAPELTSQLGCRLHGQGVLGRPGIAVNKMRKLEPFLYLGEVFDDNICPICPGDSAMIPAILAYVASGEYHENVRFIDQALKVTAATLTKVPFDLDYWIRVAQEVSERSPRTYSNDPTQWLFEGHPAGARPLQVAVARLLGYRWPQQGEDDLGAFADADGIVCLPPVAGEQPAAERLRALLAAAYGAEWSRPLSGAAAGRGRLRGQDAGRLAARRLLRPALPALPQPALHLARLGRPQGRLRRAGQLPQAGRAGLEKLIYTYLGAWINRPAGRARCRRRRARTGGWWRRWSCRRS